MTELDWTSMLAEQLDWHWQNHLRPRLDGITDDEYFWEPAGGCWNVRPRAGANAPVTFGAGDYVIEYARPEPEIPPVTTIAWRLAHVIVGVFGMRNAGHFGAAEMSWDTHRYAGTAAQALTQLDETYATWLKGVRGLDAEALARPCGPSEGPFAEYPMADLVLHINREALHHGAEIALLRDLYRAKGAGRDGL